MTNLQETNIRQELKDLVSESTQATRQEALILLDHHWKMFEIKVKLFMLYPLLKLLARAGKTEHVVMKIPYRDLETYWENSNLPLDAINLVHGSIAAQVYDRIRKNGYRPIIRKVCNIDDEEGRYIEEYWAIVIDWS